LEKSVTARLSPVTQALERSGHQPIRGLHRTIQIEKRRLRATDFDFFLAFVYPTTLRLGFIFFMAE